MQGIFVQFPSLAQFRVLAQEFEALHGILHIIGEIDESHIPIFTHVIGREIYSYRNLFHLVLLQGIVHTKCMFWNY